jgi:L-seryl-tRNA(Ser) seleniumtransferase
VKEDSNPLRALPSVQRLLDLSLVEPLLLRFGRPAVTQALRDLLAGWRTRIGAGELNAAPAPDQIIALAADRLAARQRPALRRTINATGIVLHTNLGRAPLAREAIAAVAAVTAGYCSLEVDLTHGGRGSRMQTIEPLLQELTLAEAAIAVNNGAAAILLALAALANGGEVVVSRGELVEIGGGFRVPDVIRQGGARLVEVGTTNRTRLADYGAAIGPDTRVLLKVHQSNFRTIGFTEQASLTQLAGLAHTSGLLLVADLGSGLLRSLSGHDEPTLPEAIAAGADVITCSADKLLGGPQAGLIMGRATAVDRLRQHPLLRALRLDKMSLAALESTLLLHRDTPQRIPVQRMLAQTPAELRARAVRLQRQLGAGEIEICYGFAGGGALPEERIESRALALRPTSGVDRVVERLRRADPAVMARIHDGRLLVDMLTVADDEVPALAAALHAASA